MKIRGIKTTAIKFITVLVLMAALLLASNPGAADPGHRLLPNPQAFYLCCKVSKVCSAPLPATVAISTSPCVIKIPTG